MPKTKILLATIGAAHGIKGEVRVKPLGDADMLDQYGKLETAGGQSFKITRMRLQKGMAIVKFQGVNSRDEAEALNGIDLYVDRTKLPETEDDEFYVSDLIGMVVKVEDKAVGHIKDVPNFGAGDLLEIEPNGGGSTWYLPFTEAIVPDINFETGEVTVIPPFETSERDSKDDV